MFTSCSEEDRKAVKNAAEDTGEAIGDAARTAEAHILPMAFSAWAGSVGNQSSAEHVQATSFAHRAFAAARLCFHFLKNVKWGLVDDVRKHVL